MDKTIYHQTLDILRGKTRLSQNYGALAAFIQARYGVSAINFHLDYLAAPPPPRPRLQVILMGGREAVRSVQICNGKGYTEPAKAIIAQYQALCGNYSPELALTLDGLFVYFTDLEHEIVAEIARAASPRAISSLRQQFSHLPLWRVENVFGGLHVFFYTRAQAERAEQDGTCARIRTYYGRFLIELDEFGIFHQRPLAVSFSSKETVDTEYKGNLYFYYL